MKAVYDWHDKEIRHLDEAFIAVALVLAAVMVIGAVVFLGL